MAIIVEMGRKRKPPTPWYLKGNMVCPKCACIFHLEESDFDLRMVNGVYRDPDWSISVTEDWPGGRQVIAGNCPDCKEPLTFMRYLDDAGGE